MPSRWWRVLLADDAPLAVLLLLGIERVVAGEGPLARGSLRGLRLCLCLRSLILVLSQLMVVRRRIRVHALAAARRRALYKPAILLGRGRWGSGSIGRGRCSTAARGGALDWGRGRRLLELVETHNGLTRPTSNGPVYFSPVINGCFAACCGDHLLMGSRLRSPSTKLMKARR